MLFTHFQVGVEQHSMEYIDWLTNLLPDYGFHHISLAGISWGTYINKTKGDGRGVIYILHLPVMSCYILPTGINTQ